MSAMTSPMSRRRPPNQAMFPATARSTIASGHLPTAFPRRSGFVLSKPEADNQPTIWGFCERGPEAGPARVGRPGVGLGGQTASVDLGGDAGLVGWPPQSKAADGDMEGRSREQDQRDPVPNATRRGR